MISSSFIQPLIEDAMTHFVLNSSFRTFDTLVALGKMMNGFSLVPSPFAAKCTETFVFSWLVFFQSNHAFANAVDRYIRYHILPYCCLVHRNDVFVVSDFPALPVNLQNIALFEGERLLQILSLRGVLI